MAAHTPMLHVRVDDDIKEQATQPLTAMGLSMSDAVREFLRRVVIDPASIARQWVSNTAGGSKGGGPEPEDGQ